MIKLIAVFVLIVNIVYAQRIPIDKQEHFAAGFVLGGLYSTNKAVKHPFWSSVVVATSAGILKEAYDSRINGDVSGADVCATIAGGVVSGAIIFLVRKNRINKKMGVSLQRKHI